MTCQIICAPLMHAIHSMAYLLQTPKNEENDPTWAWQHAKRTHVMYLFTCTMKKERNLICQ